MAEKHTKADNALHQADQLEKKVETRFEQPPKDKRQGALRSGEERRKVKIPPPPRSPVRSELDRRAGHRRAR